MEAYTTWISGFFLLCLMYYVGAGVYLIDRNVADIGRVAAIAIGVGTLAGGWIALALVVFATWKPWRVVLGAYLFGGVTILQLHAQGFGVAIPSEFLSMLPYIATIVVLVVICRDPKTILLNQPVSLGQRFHPDA